ncbi:MAG: AtpZ/AtpI family protein [Bacteroidales bacterium]|nr:AtpZ/AtpI family protein [Bacteroidales bacterium]
MNNWARYSALGIEMVVIVGAFVYFGIKIDERSLMQFPLWTILLSIGGIVIALMRLMREARYVDPNLPKKEDSTDPNKPDSSNNVDNSQE